jgi:multicomponent Na+:H+ antiporter subunit F
MSQIVLDVLIIAGAVLLAASAVIALYRIILGPSILDRMIGTDVILAAIMCGLGGYMAMTDRTDLLPVLIVLAMLGFVGSVSVSRYVSKSDSMTPGAEAGALSDFSGADWHMPRESQGREAQGSETREKDQDDTGAEAAPRSESPVTDEVTEIEDATYDSHADSGGEGHGTGPDPGPDDAEHMSEGAGRLGDGSDRTNGGTTGTDDGSTRPSDGSGEGKRNGS